MWWYITSKVVFGKNAVLALKDIQGKRAIIVTDESISRLGLVNKIAKILKKSEIAVRVFDKVEPEPSTQTVMKGAAIMRRFHPDWVIGLGGGSCIDAAKAMRVMYERPDLRIEDINPFNSLGLGRKARLIAIPTTSGTGSETSCFVVLTLSDGHKKVAFGSGELCPDIAIVDPVMSRSMPPKLRARSGFDALSHAIEAYGSTWNNEFSDAMAIKAIQMVFEYLPKACNDNDPTAQEKMHYAATIAQMASTNSEAGLAHAMAHKLGGHYKIPHGELISVFQVYSVQFVAKSCPRRYADMARAIGEKFDSDAEGATRFINDLRKLIETVGLPSSLRQLGIDENDFRSKLENLAAETFVDDSAIAIPRMPSVQELSRLFTYSFDGRDIDF